MALIRTFEKSSLSRPTSFQVIGTRISFGVKWICVVICLLVTGGDLYFKVRRSARFHSTYNQTNTSFGCGILFYFQYTSNYKSRCWFINGLS
jgi:hypothetical protein